MTEQDRAKPVHEPERKQSLKSQYQEQVAQEEAEMYDIGEGARRDMLSDD